MMVTTAGTLPILIRQTLIQTALEMPVTIAPIMAGVQTREILMEMAWGICVTLILIMTDMIMTVMSVIMSLFHQVRD
ncbi:MAG: hypothetical protein DRH34_10565 [Deltaproteobacteria bacterium]|nr:MAG: hypothetical protein DRH34_10565 [Deltaproteobacteria bacterium]